MIVGKECGGGEEWWVVGVVGESGWSVVPG